MREEITLPATALADGRERDGRLARGMAVARYVVLAEIGAGAMGRVYSAYDPKLDRKVALKVLAHRHTDDATSKARLLREAQALARLSHPNVVTVHDVGDHDGHVFLAMEFVDGATVRAWHAEAERTDAETIAVYRAAGEGLAAAHDAGLVHRDFKPENVMVAADGRVLVMDFGLARTAADVPVPVERTPRPVGDRLTLAGDLVGTPAYMSPEQFAGGDVGPASDQFSFCCALFEALFGTRPFAARSLRELSAAVRSGRRVPAPARSRVPAAVVAAIERGLAVEEAQRHTSMRALLDALQPGERARRWRYPIAIGAAVLAAGTGVAFAATVEHRTCATGEEKIASIWNQRRSAEIATRYGELGPRYAAGVWTRASAALDDYAAAWAQAYYDACAATRIEGAQSGARLDARMDCLSVERVRLASMLDEFERPDETVVRRTQIAVDQLPWPDTCEDPEAPSDATLDPRRRALHLEARSLVAEAAARSAAGRYDASLASTREGLAAVQGEGFDRVEAQLLQRLGRVQGSRGAHAEAEQAVRAGLAAAAKAGDDVLVARLWLDLVRVVGLDNDRPSDAVPIMEAAEIAAIAVGSDPVVARVAADTRAVLLRHRGEPEQALEHHRKALTIAEQSQARPRVLGVMLGNLGNTLYALGRYREAVAMQTEALKRHREASGDEHPDVGKAHNNLGKACNGLGDRACAIEHYGHALAVHAATVGEDHPLYADALYNLAVQRADAMQLEEARADVLRAVEIWTQSRGPRSDRVATGFGELGNIARNAGDPRAAAEYHAAAASIYREVHGDDHPWVAMPMTNEANAWMDLGEYNKALGLIDGALRIREAKLGPEHPRLAYTLLARADVLLKIGRAQGAVEAAERALRLREGKVDALDLMGYALFAVARARWVAQADRPRALELAQRAYHAYASDTGGDPADTAEVLAWLEARNSAPAFEVERPRSE